MFGFWWSIIYPKVGTHPDHPCSEGLENSGRTPVLMSARSSSSSSSTYISLPKVHFIAPTLGRTSNRDPCLAYFALVKKENTPHACFAVSSKSKTSILNIPRSGRDLIMVCTQTAVQFSYSHPACISMYQCERLSSEGAPYFNILKQSINSYHESHHVFSCP